ncbi:MAG: hypothetical protein Q9211_002977 [Gyalolechia sp. 1 TL-2023]
MAPLLKILVQWLPNLPSTSRLRGYGQPTEIQPGFEETIRQQQLIGSVQTGHGSFHPMTTASSRLSAVSWGKDHLNVFGLQGNNLTHKFWDGYTWNPSGQDLEKLGNGLTKPPVVVTWGANRLDVFGLDDHNVIKHQFYDGGGDWRPEVAQFENLGGGCDGQSNVAASTWGQDRLDVFCRGPDGDLLHQYYDATSWQPSAGSLESLGGSISSGPSVVSWGPNRLDIFALNADHALVHLYWDGYSWSEWESFGFGPALHDNSLSVSSWGENHLNIFAVDENDALRQLAWDGTQWAGWTLLSDEKFPLSGKVGVTSWSPGRIDIIALSKDTGHYLYKFYDGTSWRPEAVAWYAKGSPSSFGSNPAVVSWGENRLDIFGESVDGQLLHQAWTGYDWYPSASDWESLAGEKAAAA